MAEGDQKIEDLLNLALDATQEERRRSDDLDEEYEGENKLWEVVVRFGGTLAGSALPGWEVVELSGGYAIVTLPQNEIRALAALPQVEYVEMPKRLYFSTDAGRIASCVPAGQGLWSARGQRGQAEAEGRYEERLPTPTRSRSVGGQGVLVALIDSGLDYFHADFRNEDGSTRIAAMWDQTGTSRGMAPEGFLMGTEYTREEINAALAAGSRAAGEAIVPERDVSGHGTQVLGIAAGNGRSSGGRYRGMAPESELVVVKLGTPRENGFPRTTELMQALEYVMRKAEEFGLPVAVNISIGNVYGSHRGSSLLESYINRMADRGRSVIVVGTGNEGNTGGHTSGRLTAGEPQQVEFLINDFETTMNIQLWKDYADEVEIVVAHPDGRRIGPLGREAGTARYHLGTVDLLVYYGEPGPYQGRQEIYLDFIPTETYLDSGDWAILLTPVRVVTGEYQLWMADARARGDGTRFLQPTADATMTIPSTASDVISVGAYDARSNSYAAFSGRGWPRESFAPKPDLVAPGVDITTTAAGGGYVSVSGTSFAAPFVTGAAALLMQWGITDGNDPYLYGEKVRAYLRRGAKQLPGFARYPNNQVGYGALCVRDSLPM